MKLIIPTIITDSMLTETNIDETVSTVWDSGSTYDTGAFVYISTGTQRDIYESLQAGNINKNPTTETDWWIFRSTTYDGYNAGTTYSLDDIVIDSINHLEYKSLQDSNVGKDLTETEWWKEIGGTNPWKTFDTKVGSQTERTDKIYYKLNINSIIEGIAFFNLEAYTIDITLTDAVEGVVYSENIQLVNTQNVFDGYSYCFAPILTLTDVLRTNIPPYAFATLEISINAESHTTHAKCGEIVIGQVKEYGSTQYGGGFEIIDFSTKTQDEFGNFTVTERAFSKRVPITVILHIALLSSLKKTLEEIRAIPVVCIPTEAENLAGPFLLYGYYKSARTVVSYPEYAILTIEWEGLT